MYTIPSHGATVHAPNIISFLQSILIPFSYPGGIVLIFIGLLPKAAGRT
jgi:hypothetical protein